MALKVTRGIINNADFPVLYSQAGKSVLVNQDAGPRMPIFFSGSSENYDPNAPQMIFCENVLPFVKGMFSVGYRLKEPGPVGATDFFDQAIQLRDKAENQRLFVPAKGMNWVFDPLALTWSSLSPFTPTGPAVTRAYVEGRTFICYERNRILEYDAVTNTLITVALILPPGLTMLEVRGIGSCSNYLLLFTELTVYWCSPLNLLDFNDINAGAGAQIPIDIRGQIIAILPLIGGSLIYTTRNILAQRFTNNAAAPFLFTEVSGGGGVSSYEQVAADSNEAAHFALTTYGMQKVSLQIAEQVFPQIQDFLTGRLYDFWDPVLKQVQEVEATSDFKYKLTHLAGRYLCLSYAVGSAVYSWVLVHDVVLKRWGKLRIDHTDVYAYTFPVGVGGWEYYQLTMDYSGLGTMTYDELAVVQIAITPGRQAIAFLKPNGDQYLLDTGFIPTGDDAVMVFGHLQDVRSRDITLQAVIINDIDPANLPEILAYPSDDGVTRQPYTPLIAPNVTGKNARYEADRITGQNMDIAIIGPATVSNLIFETTVHGKR